MRATWLAVLVVGCSSGGARDVPTMTGLGGTTGAVATTTAEETASAPGSTGSDVTTDATLPPPDDGSTGPGTIAPMLCRYPSDELGAGMQELDIEPGAGDRLRFHVRGLPAPTAVQAATLVFDSHDADHPGEEGTVWVNGDGPFDLPADADWDNVDSIGSIDVTGATVAGDNLVEFGGGTFSEGTFYRIGNVQLEVLASVEVCPEGPEVPPTERTVMYTEAEYTQRQNWVLRCGAGFEYAYTARGDEHIDLDCDGLYAPDGSRSGTATFHFPEVAPTSYEIQIRSRHTTNRNPQGALFVVDGVADRVLQNDNADFTTDIWGEADLEGDVDIVLDSTMENESDSVIWVRITPL